MTPAALVLLTGFATSMALIAAIGAQNAFVLRQGIRGEHVLPVVAGNEPESLVGIEEFHLAGRHCPPRCAGSSGCGPNVMRARRNAPVLKANAPVGWTDNR